MRTMGGFLGMPKGAVPYVGGAGRKPLSMGQPQFVFKIDSEGGDRIDLRCREVYTSPNVSFILVLVGGGVGVAGPFGVSLVRFGGIFRRNSA